MKMLHALFAGLVLLFVGGMAYAEPVDINKADAQTLTTQLVGIGPSKAEAIIAYRNANGPFRSIDDLALVKGIGQATVDKNRDRLIAVDPKAMQEAGVGD